MAVAGVSVLGFGSFIEDFFGVPKEEQGTEGCFEEIEINPPIKKVKIEMVVPQEIPYCEPQLSTSASKTSKAALPLQ